MTEQRTELQFDPALENDEPDSNAMKTKLRDLIEEMKAQSGHVRDESAGKGVELRSWSAAATLEAIA